MQIVERRRIGAGNKFEYHLTKSGSALWPVLEQMGNWSQHWLRDSMTALDNINPDLFFWEVRFANMSNETGVEPRRVVEIRLTDTEATKRFYWMVFDGRKIDLCKKDPGFDVDLWVTAAAQAETRLFLNMRQRDQIRSLPATGGTVAESTQAAWADIHDTAHPANGK